MFVNHMINRKQTKKYAWLSIFVKNILSSKKNQFSFSDFSNNTNLQPQENICRLSPGQVLSADIKLKRRKSVFII